MLITLEQQSQLSGIFAEHFPLFSTQSSNFVTIVKTPVQTINNINANVLAGYGSDNMNLSDISYLPPVTGTYPAIIIYPKQLDTTQFGQLKFAIDENQVMIKIEEDAKNFILNDKTERIIIDGQAYNPELTFKVQSFLGLKYFYFRLTSTK